MTSTCFQIQTDVRTKEYTHSKFQHAALQPSNVIVDAVSMGLLKGSTLDFATELIGSSFRVIDNPQAKGAGCGCGVSWEANI
jgi:iron-sulfur cluster assembly 2